MYTLIHIVKYQIKNLHDFIYVMWRIFRDWFPDMILSIFNCHYPKLFKNSDDCSGGQGTLNPCLVKCYVSLKPDTEKQHST